MRLTRVILVLSCLSWSALLDQTASGQDGKNPQVNAARADALEGLRRDVLGIHLTPDVTIEDLIGRTDGNDELNRTLAGAEQLGDARWLGDQAVQVRLSIDGNRVGKSLLKIVKDHPKQSPLSLDELARDLEPLTFRTFSATGTSTCAGDVTRLRPPPSDRAWWGVSDADRRAALKTARNNAVTRVIGELGEIPVNGKTLGQAIAAAGAANELSSWLERQPVKAVEFDDNLSVRLTLAAPPEEAWSVLRSALLRQKVVAPPSTPAQWDDLKNAVSARLTPQGTGTVQPAISAPAMATTLIPAQPPPWAIQEIETENTSTDEGGRLRTARHAEALALEKLRSQVDALPLSGGMTVGSAAQQDPRIERAIVHALARARPVKVDYGNQGSVTVHVAFRLSHLWLELSGQQ